jgi:hypothetical protein
VESATVITTDNDDASSGIPHLPKVLIESDMGGSASRVSTSRQGVSATSVDVGAESEAAIALASPGAIGTRQILTNKPIKPMTEWVDLDILIER